MFRREAVLKVGNFDENIKGAGEDRDLQLRLLAAGCKWVWVRDASVYHPMTMCEYLKHVRWWTQGRPSVDKASRSASGISFLRFLGLQAFSLIEAFLLGAGYYSVVVHPTFLFYWPAIKMTMVSEALKAHARQYG
jgi:GT2 family glycosyltransferase